MIGRADELGSGVRNVFRYGPEYTPGGVPELIEGDVFKSIIPLRIKDTYTFKPFSNWEDVRCKFGAKFGVKFGVNSEKILELIFQDSYLSAVDIAGKIQISVRAVEKQLAKLKEVGVIERVGADKTGYWKITYEA